jgi:hypothetical protein
VNCRYSHWLRERLYPGGQLIVLLDDVNATATIPYKSQAGHCPDQANLPCRKVVLSSFW